MHDDTTLKPLSRFALLRRYRMLSGIVLATVVAAVVWWKTGGEVWWVIQQAEQLSLQSGPDEPARRLRELVLRFPQRPDAWFALAQAERHCDRLTAAAEGLRRVQQLEGTSHRVQSERELILAQSGELPDLEGNLTRRLMKADSPSREMCEAYTRGLLRRLQIPPALQLIDAWQHDFPNDATPLALRGEVHDGLMQLAQAAASFREGLHRQPARADLRLRLGSVLIKLNQPKEARIEFERAWQERPDDQEAGLGLARALIDMGELSEADTVLERFRLIIPTKSEDDSRLGPMVQLNSLLGELRLLQERATEAIPFLEAATQTEPFHSDVRYLLAKALKAAGRDAEATPHFEYAREAEGPLNEMSKLTLEVGERSRDPELRFKIGSILLKYGSPEDGARWLKSAVDLSPNHTEARRILDEYLKSKGSGTKAAVPQKDLPEMKPGSPR